jgi:Dihydroorotate dehydrogenase
LNLYFSPNTPGLRSWQTKQKLQELLAKLVAARNELSGTIKPPLLLKLAPDLTQEQRKDIADVLRDKKVRNVNELCLKVQNLCDSKCNTVWHHQDLTEF